MKNDILKWKSGLLDFTSKPVVMGILNVTPDSFSDGGNYFDVSEAVDHGLQMQADGAAIIDIGPESSRPGSLPVGPDEQIKRAVPVIEELADKLKIPISIDTYLPEVAKAAIDAGASIINDISACSNPKIATLAAQKNVPIILMHMQGKPQDMQKSPTYDDVVTEVLDFLLERARQCQMAGVQKEMIILDPGIGFGKTFQHNIELLKNLHKFVETGYRTLLGTSRKRFIGEITEKNQPSERVIGTLATTAHAHNKGVDIVRVHDVAENVEFLKVAQAIR